MRVRRIPALDGLRGIAILLVLLAHSLFAQNVRSPALSKILLVGKLSWSGVDLFFVLSGFLIGGILLDAKGSERYYQTFYARRAYRILPLYAVVLLLYFLLRPLWPANWLGFDITKIPAWSFLTFTQNIWLAWSVKFDGSMIPTWSLAVEEQFYLLIPVLVRKLNRSQLAIILVSTVFAAPLLRTLLVFLDQLGGYAAYVLMPCRADALSLGVLTAMLTRNPEAEEIALRVVRPIALLSFVALGWLSYKGYGPFSKPMATYGYTVLAMFYACCLVLALSAPFRVLEQRPLRNLGAIAYGTYLLHFPLIFFGATFGRFCLKSATFHHAKGTAEVLGSALGIGLALLLASLSWKWFEQPLLHYGRRHRY